MSRHSHPLNRHKGHKEVSKNIRQHTINCRNGKHLFLAYFGFKVLKLFHAQLNKLHLNNKTVGLIGIFMLKSLNQLQVFVMFIDVKTFMLISV